MNCWRFMLKVC